MQETISSAMGNNKESKGGKKKMIHLHKNIIIRMKRDIIKSRVELHFMNKAENSLIFGRKVKKLTS